MQLNIPEECTFTYDCKLRIFLKRQIGERAAVCKSPCLNSLAIGRNRYRL